MYVEMTLIHVPFKYSISELYTIPLLFAHLITFVCLCVSVSVSVCVHVCVHTYKIRTFSFSNDTPKYYDYGFPCQTRTFRGCFGVHKKKEIIITLILENACIHTIIVGRA